MVLCLDNKHIGDGSERQGTVLCLDRNKGKDTTPFPVFYGLTKLGRGSASRMSAKVFGKGIVSGIASDLVISTSFGVISVLEEKFDEFLDGFSENEAIYWCVA